MQDKTLTISSLMYWAGRDFGGVVNFEDVGGLRGQHPAFALEHEQHYHHSDFCLFVKGNGGMRTCSVTKNRSKKIARHGRRFEGCCPFGVWDCAQPVMVGDRLMGILYCGSLQAPGTLPRVQNRPFVGTVHWAGESAMRLARSYCRSLADIISLVYRRHLGEKVGHESRLPSEHYREVVTAFIRNRHHTTVRLRDLASVMHLHPNYLGRRIHELFGKSFTDLLREYRIKRAQTLLGSVLYSVGEIAEAVGFTDPNYFSYVFRAETGMSPREFRRTKSN